MDQLLDQEVKHQTVGLLDQLEEAVSQTTQVNGDSLHHQPFQLDISTSMSTLPESPEFMKQMRFGLDMRHQLLNFKVLLKDSNKLLKMLLEPFNPTETRSEVELFIRSATWPDG